MQGIDPFRIPTYVRLVDTGTDQIASPRNNPAWWEFEDPLPTVLLALAETLEGTAMYDVGANTGFYSVLLGKTRPDLPLRVFEPIPDIAAMCRANLEVNLLDVPVIEEALSDRVGHAQVFVPSARHGMVETSASLNPWFTARSVPSIQVPTTTVDAFVNQTGDRVGLMKIDVEGFEHVVLRGTGSTVARDRPVLAVEVLPTSALDELAAFVEATGYSILSLLPGVDVNREPGVAFHEHGWNQLFVPAERLDEVEAILAGVRERMRVTRADPVSAWGDVATAQDYLHLHAVAEARRQVLESQQRVPARVVSGWRKRLRRR